MYSYKKKRKTYFFLTTVTSEKGKKSGPLQRPTCGKESEHPSSGSTVTKWACYACLDRPDQILRPKIAFEF